MAVGEGMTLEGQIAVGSVPQPALVPVRSRPPIASLMLGHAEARLTLDIYAQAVAKLGEAAAEAMGARFLGPAPRDGRAMEHGPDGEAA